jgi:hypothetical protein
MGSTRARFRDAGAADNERLGCEIIAAAAGIEVVEQWSDYKAACSGSRRGFAQR